MLKKILLTFGIIVVLLLAAAVILPVVFKDDIVQAIKDEANNNLNARMDFGEFDLSLIRSFPDFSFSMKDLTIVGIGDFEKDTLIALDGMGLTVDLMSVISGSEMKIKTVELDGARMTFRVLADGRANWDIAKEGGDAAGEGDAAGTKAEEEAAPFKAALKKLEVKNAHIVYDDASLPFSMVIRGFDYVLSGDFTADFTSVKSTGTIRSMDMTYDGVKYLSNANLDLRADLDADMKTFTFTFKDNEIRLNELFLGLNGKFGMPDAGYDMDLTFSAKKNEFRNFLSLVPAVYSQDFASVKTSGKLALDGYVKGLYTDEKMPGFGVSVLIEDAMFRYPDLPGAVDKINIDVKVDNPDGEPDNTLIDIRRFHVEMAQNPFDMHMRIATPVSDPSVDGAIRGVIDLARMKDVIPSEQGDELSGVITADLELKGRQSSIDQGRYEEFHAAGGLTIEKMNYRTKDFPQGMAINRMRFNFTPQYLELAEFNSMIGKSDLQAAGRLQNYLAYALQDSATLSGNLSITSASFDLNEFMEDEAPEGGEASATTAAAAAPEDTVPLSVIEIPPFIDFTASARFGRLLYDNLPMDNVGGTLKVKDRTVWLENFAMNTLDGKMTVNGTYDTKDVTKPKVDFRLDIADFDVEQTASTFSTVTEIAPIAKSCKGKYSTAMSFTTELDEHMEPVMNTLSGGGALKTKNIKVEGFEPLEKLADVLRNEKLGKWELNDVNFTFRLADGRVHVSPIDFQLGKTKARLEGSNGFDQTLDYKMNLVIPRGDLGGDAVNDLLAKAGGMKVDNIPVDVLIGGTVTDPTITPSFGSLAGSVKDQAKEIVGKKVEEVKEKVNEELRARADKLIADAEKQAQKVRDEGRAAAQKVRSEAEAQAKKVEAEGKGNLFKEKAAKAAADKLRQEGNRNAQKIEDDANRTADGIVAAARKQADELLNRK